KPRSGVPILKPLALTINSDLQDLRLDRLGELLENPRFRFYEVVDARPLNGAPDRPDSPFALTVVAHHSNADEAGKLRSAPGPVLELIRQKLGVVNDVRFLNVTDAQLAGPTDPGVPPSPAATDIYFRATVQPTSVARRIWPHEPALFFG